MTDTTSCIMGIVSRVFISSSSASAVLILTRFPSFFFLQVLHPDLNAKQICCSSPLNALRWLHAVGGRGEQSLLDYKV